MAHGPGPGGRGSGGHGPGFGIGFGHFAGGNPHVGVTRGTTGHNNGDKPPKPSFKKEHDFMPDPHNNLIIRCYSLLAVIMAFTMIVGNVLGAKVWSIGWVILDGGFILTPLGMCAQDIMNEVFYKDEADRVVGWVAILNIVAAAALMICAHILPGDPNTANPDFVAVFGASARIYVASSIAYYIRGRVNNRVYEQMRESTEGDVDITARSIVSSFCGRLFDTSIFTILAFAGRAGFFTTLQQTFWSFLAATAIEALLSRIIVTPVSRSLIKRLKK